MTEGAKSEGELDAINPEPDLLVPSKLSYVIGGWSCHASPQYCIVITCWIFLAA
jgi:hypothetical protein